MALGQYTQRPSKGKTNTFKPQNNANKPLLIVPREFITGFTSEAYKERGEQDVLLYDIVDLSTAMTPTGLNLAAATIVPTVITGAGAIVDDLKRFVPGGPENQSADEKMMALKFIPTRGKGPNEYYICEQLSGPELQLAAAWDSQHGLAAIHQARAAHEAQVAATVAANPVDAAAQQIAALQAQLAAAQGGAAPAVTPAPSNVTPINGGAAPAANPAAAYNDANLAAAIANLNLTATPAT